VSCPASPACPARCRRCAGRHVPGISPAMSPPSVEHEPEIERGDEEPRRTGFPRPLAKSGLDLAIEVRTLASASAGWNPGDGRLYPAALLVSGVPQGRAPRRPSIPIRSPWRFSPADAIANAPWALILPPAR